MTHIFYHSLVVDPERGFAGDDSIAAGFKQWMTTMDEFNKITQTMYDNGYVMVRLRIWWCRQQMRTERYILPPTPI